MTLAAASSPAERPAARPAAAPEFAYTDQDFQRIARLAHREFGLNLPDSKKPLVYSRLARRLRVNNLDAFAPYIDLLESGRDDTERRELLSALTTNVTNFFREPHHFDILRRDLLPALVDRARSGGRVRLWSAGCSSGQEPYSLAMVLLDALPDAARRDVKILATDIDPVVIDRARAGHYPVAERDQIPQAQRSAWTLPPEPAAKTFAVAPALQALITFNTLNLVADWPLRGPFDAIFCRNVAIYFDQPTQSRLWTRFGQVLAPGGLLMIGHSERLTDRQAPQFRTVGVTAYQRTDAPAGTTQESTA